MIRALPMFNANVQILERAARGGRHQKVTLSAGGMVKLQQCKSGREAEGRRKWHVFSENIWECMQNHITEKM